MPRVRLFVRHHQPIPPLTYTDPGTGSAREFPELRLETNVYIGPNRSGKSRLVLALIDTGAFITVIEHDEWRRLDRLGMIEHLHRPSGATATTIGGVRSRFDLGRLRMQVVEFRPPNRPVTLPPVSVVAQLLLDPAVRLPYPIILGLHGGVLDSRRLGRDPVPPAPPPYPRHDAGPAFGQEWWLEG